VFADPVQWQRQERRTAEFSTLDILVNNAAFPRTDQTITTIPADPRQDPFATNIVALFYRCKAASPHLKAGAPIINTCSVEAVQPEPLLLAYAATKAAVVNVTKGLAKELRESGTRGHRRAVS